MGLRYAPHRPAQRGWTYSTVRESTFLAGDGGKEQQVYAGSLESQWAKTHAKLTVDYLDVTDNWGITKGTTATRSGGPGSISETPSSTLNNDLQFTLSPPDQS